MTETNLRKWIEQANLILLLCIAATFVFPIKINSICIILFCANQLVRTIITKNYDIKFNASLLFVLLFLLYIGGLAYSENFIEAKFSIEKKLSLMIFPVVFLNARLSDIIIKKTLTAFFASVACASILCLLLAGLSYFSGSGKEVFFSHKLSGFIGIHANYLAIYVCFSFFIVLFLLHKKFKELSIWQRIIHITLLCFYTFFLFLLSARMQIIIFCLIFFCWQLILFYKAGKPLIGATVFFVTLAILFSLLYFNNNNKERFKELINYKSEYGIKKQWGGRAVREINWDCALAVAKENLYMGAGTGDVQDELNKCFKQKNYVPLLFWEGKNFNAHNQYLEIAIAIGLPGLALFIIIIFSFLYNAFSKKNFIFAILIIIFSVSCISESCLERHWGIVFFTFFSSLFLSTNLSKNSDNCRLMF